MAQEVRVAETAVVVKVVLEEQLEDVVLGQVEVIATQDAWRRDGGRSALRWLLTKHNRHVPIIFFKKKQNHFF